MSSYAFLAQFVDDLKAQRMRTTLTILGITWGTVAVVVMLAFGVGFQRQMEKSARAIGEGIVIMFPGKTTQSYHGFAQGRQINYYEQDIPVLAREIPEIAMISPEYANSDTPVRRGTASLNPFITGVYPIYGQMRWVYPEAGGRFVDEPDLQQRRRVVVLGDEVKNVLFGDDDAVGKAVQVGGTTFTVIGVMQKKKQDSSYGDRDKNRIFIPASTYRAVFGANRLRYIIFTPKSPALSKYTQNRVYEVLSKRYTFDPQDRDALGMWDTNEGLKFFHSLFLGFNMFMGIVGAFTLTVGGIGVANIMYIVVRERTREIGIKRSIGATRRSIQLQFMLETSLVVATGALLGFIMSLAIIYTARLAPIEEQVGTPTISPIVLFATIGLLGGIAFLAGVFPARKAASLDPVECLRS